MIISKSAKRITMVAAATIAVYMLIVVSLSQSAPHSTSTTPSPSHVLATSDIDTSQLYSLTNNDRTNAHVQQLSLDPKLNASASIRCQDMASKHYYSHVSPDGTQWYESIEAQEQYAFAGENLAVYWSDASAQRVNQEWLNSSEHRANIQNAKFTNVGFATCLGTYGGRSALFVVEHFTQASTKTSHSAPAESTMPTTANTLAQCAIANNSASITYSGVYNTEFNDYMAYSTSHTPLNDPNWSSDDAWYKQTLNNNLKVEYSNLQLELSLKGCSATFYESLLV